MAVTGNTDRRSTGVQLALADGQRWVIRPADTQSAEAIAELRQVMRLDLDDQGPEIHVAVCGTRAGAFDCATDKDRLLCFVPHRLSRDLELIQMQMIASFVAHAALRRGALLLHGALAECCGSGFIMAGPGTIGKSTASRRLPSPWRSLCDDMTLAVRDDAGQYWAHPWPTWSRFKNGGPGGSWAVEQAVPLRAVFFLSRSPSDRLEPVNATQATALTLESALNLARSASSPFSCLRSPVSFGIRAAKALASAVPAYSLKLSLVGRFWEEIERVLPKTGDRPPSSVTCPFPVSPSPSAHLTHRSLDPSISSASASCPTLPAQFPSDGSTLEPFRLADGSLRVVYVGSGMDPALVAPDFIEVRPYGTERVRPGDVVCFNSPEWKSASPLAATSTMVVHRVVSVRGRGTGDGGPQDGIRTRGDNNPEDDPWVLQDGDIIGRVVAAQRGTRRRVVPGGRQGFFALGCVRLGQGIRRFVSLLPHKLHDLIAGLGPLDHLLPRSLRPRLVRFDARYRMFLKLLSGRQMVGQYDALRAGWHIRWPFRLFVDEQAIRDAGSLASGSEPGHVP